ncbi:MAG: hypothetical protein NC452_14885 [Eubacterium sp.]|nr:hypothetical protein [Eubacterium sp.]
MKKKIISAFILTALLLTALLLSGCSKNSETDGEYFRIVSQYNNICNNGEFYSIDGEKLLFCDFEAMRTAYICAKPNCPHTDENSCSAFGMVHHPVLYGGNIYYFTYDAYINDDNICKFFTVINRADTDGTNRKEMYKMDGLFVSEGDRFILDGSKVYFNAEDVEFDEYGASTNYTVGYYCSYDFESGEFENIAEIYRGYSSGIWEHGIWNGDIYYYTSVSENKINWETIDISKDDVMGFYTLTQHRFNIADKTFSENDLPEPLYIGEGYYVYGTENGVCLKPENGEDIFIDNFKTEFGLLYIMNGYLISSERRECAEISTGKVYKINPEYASDEYYYTPKLYLNGNFILEKPWTDEADMTDRYVSVSEADFIGEEIV